MLKLLITGTDSFIGNAVRDRANQSGTILAETLSVRGDRWKSADFSGYDSILHAAGIAHVSPDPSMTEQYQNINHLLTAQLAARAKAQGVRQFIFLSSIIVFGDAAPVGVRRVIRPDTVPAPSNAYGQSKLDAENALRALEDERFRVVILRLPMVYGPGCRGNYNLLSRLAIRLPFFPLFENQRSMLYVENLAALIPLLMQDNASGIYYPRDTHPRSVPEIVRAICLARGQRVRFSRALAWGVRACRGLGLVRRAFGDMAYSQDMPDYPGHYREVDFPEAIRRTETQQLHARRRSVPRVLEIITTPLAYDGQTGFPLRIVRQMDRSTVRVDFLSFRLDNPRIQAEIQEMDSRLHLIPHRLRHPVRYLRQTAGLIRRERYGVVHVHGSSHTIALELLAAALGGAKVRIAHSHNTDCKYRLLHRLLTPFFHCLYTDALACGEEAGRWMFGKHTFVVIPNAIDVSLFRFDPVLREDARREFGFSDAPVLGSVAHFVPAKNHPFLLEVFAAFLTLQPDARLLLVGEGPLRSEIKAQAHALGIAEKVIFTGVRTDIPRLLQAMDVMLLPSLFEGFPTVMPEWQSAGLPVLAADTVTRHCAFTDSVQFLPLDSAQWVQALSRLPEPDRAQASETGMEAVAAAGYDISDASSRLLSRYLQPLYLKE